MSLQSGPSVTETDCVIIGAGIAGLVAALSFERLGYSVRILERNIRLDEAGAGLQLSPNATSILSVLGLLAPLLAHATVVRSIDLCDGKTGKTLLALPTGTLDADAPFLSVHRADLQKTLLEAVRNKESIRLHLGAQIQTIEKSAGRQLVTFVQNDDARSFITPLVVGADGIKSETRALVSQAKLSHSGFTAMRATVNIDQLTPAVADYFSQLHVRAFVSNKSHLIAYPVSNGQRVNVVMIAKSDKDAQVSNRAFTGFGGAARPLLSFVSSWTDWPLYTLDATKPWTNGLNIALVGDAAHAMLPFAAQGAGMAIEDSFTLADAVSKHKGNTPQAFAEYENLRKERVMRVIKRTHFNRFAYHAWGPVALARNLVFKLRGPALLDDLRWLYEYRAPGA